MCTRYPLCDGEHVGCCGGSGKLAVDDSCIQTQLVVYVLYLCPFAEVISSLASYITRCSENWQ